MPSTTHKRTHGPTIHVITLLVIAALLMHETLSSALMRAAEGDMQPRAYLPLVSDSHSRAYIPLVIDTTPRLIPAPTHLSGAPLQAVVVNNYVSWYLPPDGRIIISGGAVEPYPLTPTLGIRNITTGPEQDPPGLLAATAHGLYLRDALTFRWQKFSSMVASHISTCWNYIWVVPDDHPDEIWESRDSGQTWVTVSQGLQGIVVSQINLVAICAQLKVITIVDGQYVLWKRFRTDDPSPWMRYLTLPGEAVAFTPGGVPASFAARWSQGVFFVGSTDGHIYQSVFDQYPYEFDHWESVGYFGPGKYPIMLDWQHVSVLDLQTGGMQLYSLGAGVWYPSVFPQEDVTWGIMPLPDGHAVRRIYGTRQWGDLFARMMLTWNGDMYAWEFNGDETNGAFVYNLITPTPQRTDFVIGNEMNSGATVQTLFSGSSLAWEGSTCVADENTFYRSSDKGVTWTPVVTDTERYPVAATHEWSGPAYWVLAQTCAGPTLSSDAGEHWRTPLEIWAGSNPQARSSWS